MSKVGDRSVEALFTNIKHDEILQCLQNNLSKRQNTKVPTDFVMKLMKIILTQNRFSFHDALWKQEVGATMGSNPIPGYADSFMASIDNEIKSLKFEEGQNTLPLLKRVLDDFFGIFNLTTKELHRLLYLINQINPNIRLTLSHTAVPGEAPEDICQCPPLSSIPFVDTLCSLKDKRIETDLYIKPTDRN